MDAGFKNMTEIEYKILKAVFEKNPARYHSDLLKLFPYSFKESECEYVRDNLLHLNYITERSQYTFLITEKGNKELNIYEFEQKRKIEEELRLEALRYSVKNAKRIFKTYWGTVILSVLSFLLATGKIIYDILKD